jgi:hypothetical protein
MELDPRKPFAENIASGLQGLGWRTTFFLYLLAVVVLVPVSMVTVRILGQGAPTYLVPLLVSLFLLIAYLYSLKSIFKRGPAHLLPCMGLLAAITYAAYWLPPGFMDQSWPHFDVLRRSTLWLVRGTAFRSLAGPLLLFVTYAAIYYWLRIRGRRFIVVSDFRVWGNLEKKSPAKGVAGRLQDELMRLLADMRSSDSDFPTESSRAVAASELQRDDLEPHPPLGESFAPPPTQVTLQYEGISLEGLHTFIRRTSGREVVVTGDLFAHPNGFVLVARTENDGPWEVLIQSLDSISLGIGLQRMALRILTTLAQGFLPKEPNNFVFLRFKAEELEEYNLVVRLAKLASNAIYLKSASTNDDVTTAQENLADAYFKRGLWHFKKGRFQPAKRDFIEATEWDPNDFLEAWEKLAEANHKLGLTVEAKSALSEANRIKAAQGKSEAREQSPGSSNGS